MTHKPTLRSHTHWQAPRADTQTKACQRVCLPYRTDDRKEQRRHNSTYKKLAVQWLNEVKFFNQTFVQVDSFVLRNRQLLIAANRYKQAYDDPCNHQADTKTPRLLTSKLIFERP